MKKLVFALTAATSLMTLSTGARADEESQLRQLAESAVLAAAQPRLTSPEGVFRLCDTFDAGLQSLRSTRSAEAPVQPDGSGFLRPGSRIVAASLEAYEEFCAATKNPQRELSAAAKLVVVSGYNIRVTLGSTLQHFRAETTPPPVSSTSAPPRSPLAYLPWVALGTTGLCALVSGAFLVDAFVRDNRRLDAASSGEIDRRADESLRDAIATQKTGAGVSTAICAVGAAGASGWLLWQRQKQRTESRSSLALRLDVSPSVASRSALFRVGLSF